MKYLILIHSNEASRQAWEGLSQEQRSDLGRGHLALRELLAESGELIVSEGLVDPSHAKRVRVRDGETIATDGPFAEVKEHLAGFYLIECDSMERAVELAAKAPDAAWGEVEVRPIFDLNGIEF
ncbi:YciI family protein [Amycolatopsis minnesotensis]|uniref:YciI family protein n=1 Tax=Amycolatopsis minnesotensis TaxID=337894 RepID=A0ABP5CI97_9PSEU